MGKKELLWLVAGVVLGIVLQPQITRLPLVSKIPSV